MISELAYFAAEIVAITTLALVGLCFLITLPRNFNARIFALICASKISFMIFIMEYNPNPVFQVDLSAIWFPMQIAQNMTGGLLMILCYSLFHDSKPHETKRFPRWLLAVYGFQLCLSALRPLYVPNRISDIDIASIGELTYFVFGDLPLILSSSFVVIALYWTLKNWAVDLIEDRRLLRVIVASFSLLSLGITVTHIYLGTVGPSQPYLVAVTGTVMVLLSALGYVALALTCLRFDTSILERVIDTVRHEKNSDLTTEEIKAEIEHFYRIFRDQQCYLQPGLSIAELASKLSMPQYKLRNLVNRKLGYRNFNALLNEYRIEEACKQFSNADKNHLPILTIALSIGYQSIAPFNQAFRELKGVAPSVYRRQSKVGSIQSAK